MVRSIEILSTTIYAGIAMAKWIATYLSIVDPEKVVSLTFAGRRDLRGHCGPQVGSWLDHCQKEGLNWTCLTWFTGIDSRSRVRSRWICMKNAMLVRPYRLLLLDLERISYSILNGSATRSEKDQLLGLAAGFIFSLVGSFITPSQVSRSSIIGDIVGGLASPWDQASNYYNNGYLSLGPYQSRTRWVFK